MTFRNKLYLTWQYGKAQLVLGAVYNVVCTLLLAQGFSYMFFMDSFIVKAALTAVALYLIEEFRDRDAIFFYINLGLSRRRLIASVTLIDFLALAIMLTVVLLIYA